MTKELIAKNLQNLSDDVIKTIVVEAYANHQESKRYRYFIIEKEDIEVNKLEIGVQIKKVDDGLTFMFFEAEGEYQSYFWDDDTDLHYFDPAYLGAIVRKHKLTTI